MNETSETSATNIIAHIGREPDFTSTLNVKMSISDRARSMLVITKYVVKFFEKKY